jgi:hypothetical protein
MHKVRPTRQKTASQEAAATQQAAPGRRELLEELRASCTCSIETASIALGVGRSTAYAAARDGSLPVIRISNRLLVPTRKLISLLGLEGDECDAPEGEQSDGKRT